MSLEPGQIIDGKYRIVRLIGEGGMGSVHEGENTFISRRVAIKVLHASAAGNEAVLKRFEREAQAAGRIGSDHILEVLDLGTLDNGDRYMVMEYLEGEELSSRIERQGGLPAEQLSLLMRQSLVGLRAAHAAEIVHRDLKPDNIFILWEKAGHADFVKIIDFGISKFNALSPDMSMTTTGAVMGTPYYMSPEQAKGASGVDARTDLYALGVIMYEALTGRVPFEGTSFNDLMFKIVLSEPPPLPETIPEDFRAIVHKAMARQAEDRFQSADEFLAALEAWMDARGLLGRLSSSSVEMSQLGTQRVPTVAAATAQQTGPETTDKSARTHGNWAATNGAKEVPAGTRRKGPIVAGVVAATLFAAGAGAYFWGPNSVSTARQEVEAEPTDETTSASEPSSAAAEEQSTQPAPASEPESPVAPTPQAEQTRALEKEDSGGSQASEQKAEAKKKAESEQKTEPAARKAPEKTAPRRQPPSTRTTRSTSRPAPAPRPRPTPTRSRQTQPDKENKERSVRDFGY